jgi:hypothetical protein
MKNIIFVAALVVLAFIGKTAATECAAPNPCDGICQTNSFGTYLCEKSIFDSPLFENRFIGKKSQSRVSFYGWMLTGITVNNHGATNQYDGLSAYGYNNRLDRGGNPIRNSMTDQSGNSYVLMLEQPADWKLNQLWLGAKRDLDNHFGWGFQSDFVYGTDLRYARNWGDGSFDYTWGSGDYFASFSQEKPGHPSVLRRIPAKTFVKQTPAGHTFAKRVFSSLGSSRIDSSARNRSRESRFTVGCSPGSPSIITERRINTTVSPPTDITIALIAAGNPSATA